MEDVLELVGLQPESETECGLRFEGGGGQPGAWLDRLTPYGGLASWSHYLEQVGIVEKLARQFPLERTNPNATSVRDPAARFHDPCAIGRQTI